MRNHKTHKSVLNKISQSQSVYYETFILLLKIKQFILLLVKRLVDLISTKNNAYIITYKIYDKSFKYLRIIFLNS